MVYINFYETPFKGKTKRFILKTVRGGFNLGSIRFYPQWRTYIFIPNMNTIFDSKCLDEISDFVKSINGERIQNLKMK